MRVGEGIKGVWEEERQERGREGVWVNGKGGVREGCDTVISLTLSGSGPASRTHSLFQCTRGGWPLSL